MLKTLLVDDETVNVKILKGLLEQFCPEVEIVGDANNINDAIAKIRIYKPDLLFLDIEMPFGSGFDLLDKLMPVDFDVVFVTAFDNYTLKAFKYCAMDYLLKPVNIDELKTVVKRSEENQNKKNINIQLSNLLSNISKSDPKQQQIAIPLKDELVFIFVRDILRCEAKGGYTLVYTKTGEKYLSSKSIKEYEDILPEEQFFRIHHSAIINMKFIKKYHKGRGGVIELQDGTMVDVAIRRRDEFLAKFGYK